jgi:hypothetical protein
VLCYVCLLSLLPHEIHINCHITITAILELLPQPPEAWCKKIMNTS